MQQVAVVNGFTLKKWGPKSWPSHAQKGCLRCWKGQLWLSCPWQFVASGQNIGVGCAVHLGI